jgi:hypothetical protein
MSYASDGPSFLPWQRWLATLWLVIWIPIYWRTWGPTNFLQLCDIAVILTCVGIWTGSSLLISSQAISSLAIDFFWVLDAGARLISGRHFIGGTEYLFDPHYLLWVRLLSLFHVAMPFLLIWALRRVRYDSRGLWLQCVIAYFAFYAAHFTNPAKNMNFAFADPFFHRAWGPAPLHALINTIFMLVAVYLPTHWILKRFLVSTNSAQQRNSNARVTAA